MNLLVTTLGMSWQIVPELLGFTNPDQYDFFQGNKSVLSLRQEHKIQRVDECWVITVESQREEDLQKLQKWAQRWNITLKIVICQGVLQFATQNEIQLMRSLIYRIVLKATSLVRGDEKLYLSLSGGRKTMSADMQEAGNLFGCAAMLHVVDCNGLPEEMKENDLLANTNGKFAEDFMPVIVNDVIEPSLVVSAGEKRIESVDFPFEFSKETVTSYPEDGTLEETIQTRRGNAAQIYANFYSSLNNEENQGRDIFRKLYFLHPDRLRKLKERKIGNEESFYEQDMEILRNIPKADLHTHLGGVLTPKEIIKTAMAEDDRLLRLLQRGDLTGWHHDVQIAIEQQNMEELNRLKTEIFKTKKTDFTCFYDKLLIFLCAFQKNASIFEKLVFGENNNFHQIGIDSYQKLGDFQGSSLLQTKKTIAAAVNFYAQKLVQDNVRYVEIRCSPDKYTQKGLSEIDVVNVLMDTLEQAEYQNIIEYRIICIVGRDAGPEDIKKSIEKIKNLMSEERISKKLIGIDLAGNEGSRGPEELRNFFMTFLEKCIHITIHAGETESVNNIWKAVYHLSADRIGHGLNLADQPEMIPHFINKNIGIEMCPSSNIQVVGYGKADDKPYPLSDYIKKGLKVTLNTDNCGISRTSLSQEFYQGARLCGGLSLWDCLVLVRNSLSIAFADSQCKKRLLRDFENRLCQLYQDEGDHFL